jgi:hypothetical protein
MKKCICLTLSALLLMSSAALAAPTAKAVKSVVDHFNSGAEVILVEYKFCSDITLKGENKNECADTLDPVTLNKEDKVYLWMSYMVPKKSNPNILVQFNKSGRTMLSRDITLIASLSARTWIRVPTGKSGAWTIAIDQETDDSFTNISTLTYSVSDVSQ